MNGEAKIYPKWKFNRAVTETYPAVLHLLDLFGEALKAVSADHTMPAGLPAAARGRLLVIAVGKAAARMMYVAQSRASGPITGLIVTRHGHLDPELRFGPGIESIEAGHPYPDASSFLAAQRTLDLVGALEAGDQLLLLLSGGGSALLAAPADGLTLADKQAVTRGLLQSGATISEINCVRKHLSKVKGGRLAQRAGAAKVTTWAISDVPGDDLSFIASGPTAPDLTTLAMARDIVQKYELDLPQAVVRALNDPANETPAPDTLGLAGAEFHIIARALDALKAASVRADALGYSVMNLGDDLQAEARYLGSGHAALARRLASDGARRAIISGGETTVTVTNKSGKGGRNLEYLLSLAICLDGAEGISAIACDTDGIDGTDDAAGAVITPDTLRRSHSIGLDARTYLAENNAYVFFERLGDLVITGPTQTNVNDFRAILIEGRPTPGQL
jgi:hydroxypyruvate reductase